MATSLTADALPVPQNITALLDGLLELERREEDLQDAINALLRYGFEASGHEVQVLVDILDQTLGTIKPHKPLFQRHLRLLCEICGSRGLVPSSYLLTERLDKVHSLAIVQAGSSDIWEGRYKGRRVAIKYLRISERDDQEDIRKRLCLEVVVWKSLSHTNVLPVLGIHGSSFPLCMVSPWMSNGKIMDYLRVNPRASRPALLIDICTALEFLHSLDIIHGNLKSNNLLISVGGRALLTNFGLSSIETELGTTVPKRYRPACETYRWMAPELLLPDEDSSLPTKASDIYAWAMVAFELFSGRLPFQDLGDPSVVIQVGKGVRPERPLDASHLTDDIWGVIESSWQQDPRKRQTSSCILNALILSGGRDIPLCAINL